MTFPILCGTGRRDGKAPRRIAARSDLAAIQVCSAFQYKVRVKCFVPSEMLESTIVVFSASALHTPANPGESPMYKAVAIEVACLSLLFAAAPVRATTIVIMRTANGFVVGADSRLTDANGEPLPATVCKIFESHDNVIWGFGGLHELGAFQPSELLPPLIGGIDVHESLAKIRNVLIPALADQAKQLKMVAPVKYTKLLAGDDIFDVFIVTVHEAIVEGYRVSEDSFGRAIVQPSASIDCKEGPSCSHGRIMNMGQKDEINSFLAAHAMAVAQIPSDADRVKFLIQLEADVNPKTVAAPFSIVEIDSEGVHWADPKDHCRPSDTR